MEEIEVKIGVLSNGIKVVNLFMRPIIFDDGTSVSPTKYNLRLSTLKQGKEPPNVDVWEQDREVVRIRFLKGDTVPRVEDIEWLRRNIPKDVLILANRTKAEYYGFPCVSPVFSSRINEIDVSHSISDFLWS